MTKELENKIDKLDKKLDNHMRRITTTVKEEQQSLRRVLNMIYVLLEEKNKLKVFGYSDLFKKLGFAEFINEYRVKNKTVPLNKNSRYKHLVNIFRRMVQDPKINIHHIYIGKSIYFTNLSVVAILDMIYCANNKWSNEWWLNKVAHYYQKETGQELSVTLFEAGPTEEAQANEEQYLDDKIDWSHLI